MKEDNNSSRYVITFIIIMIVVGIMFALLYMANNATKKISKPISATTQKKVDPPIIVSNFSAPLSTIIGDLDFYGNYDLSERYSGAKFMFKCTIFDETQNECIAGEAIMDTGSAKVKLFDYSSEEDNYLKRSDEFFLLVDDNYIITVHDRTKDKNGFAIIQDREGKEITRIEDITTYYNHGKEVYKTMYPNVDDNTMTYYMCNNKKVQIVSKDLTNNDKYQIIQNVDDGTCN